MDGSNPYPTLLSFRRQHTDLDINITRSATNAYSLHIKNREIGYTASDRRIFKFKIKKVKGES